MSSQSHNHTQDSCVTGTKDLRPVASTLWLRDHTGVGTRRYFVICLKLGEEMLGAVSITVESI